MPRSVAETILERKHPAQFFSSERSPGARLVRPGSRLDRPRPITLAAGAQPDSGQPRARSGLPATSEIAPSTAASVPAGILGRHKMWSSTSYDLKLPILWSWITAVELQVALVRDQLT